MQDIRLAMRESRRDDYSQELKNWFPCTESDQRARRFSFRRATGGTDCQFIFTPGPVMPEIEAAADPDMTLGVCHRDDYRSLAQL